MTAAKRTVPAEVMRAARGTHWYRQSDLADSLSVSRDMVSTWEREGGRPIDAWAMVGLLLGRGELHSAGVLLQNIPLGWRSPGSRW